MELKDGAGRKINYLRMSITDRCNLRCRYCMPEEGHKLVSHDDVLSLEEFAEVADRFVRIFEIDKIRLTGGEPLIKRNIEFLIRHLASNPGIKDLALTTNGILLKSKGRSIYDAGMRRLNVSIDSLNPDRFKEITRGGNLQDSLDGLLEAKEIGFSPIKINVVLLPGFDEELKFIEWANSSGFHVRFIELMQGLPTGIDADKTKAPRMPEILDRLEQKLGVSEMVENGDPGRHTMVFKNTSTGWLFEFIPSITNHFCNQCNRIRINSEGFLRLCLYSSQTMQIKPLLTRSDDEFRKVIEDFAKEKKSRQSDQMQSYMFRVGG